MSQLPEIGEVIAPVLEKVPRAQQPLLVAIAERMAADRYRSWAAEPELAEHHSALLHCARREEEIATRIESLFPDAAKQQRALREQHPGLAEINRSLFAGRPLPDQLTIQARGERLGAATWRSFAKDAAPDARSTYEICARLEEESALVLEGILGVS